MKILNLWIVGALASIIGIALVVQQLQSKRLADQRPPVFMVVCFDVSNSGTEEDKLLYGQQAMRLIRSLDPDRDHLLLIRYDRDAVEVGSEVPQDLDAFTFTLKESILRPSTVRGTRPAVLFDHINKSLSRYDLQGTIVEVVIMTDGGNDDLSHEMNQLYAESVKHLTALPELERVLFWGVRDGLREGIRARFKDLDSQGRLTILGPRESL